jgi:hypothetical protein
MAQIKKSADYDQVIAEVFSRVCVRERPPPYEFDKSLVELVVDDLVRKKKIDRIKNIPDIKYTYDARRGFPPEISRRGEFAIVGKGKSKYEFVKLARPNLIRLPEDLPCTVSTTIVVDDTPELVRNVLGEDEQATMTRVHSNNLIGRVTGFRVYRVQGHERTTVHSLGQIEVDEVYVGTNGTHRYVLPISAKGGEKDCLSYTQALNLNMYGHTKTRYSGHIVMSLGVAKKLNGDIYIVGFSSERAVELITISRAERFRLETSPPSAEEKPSS